MDLADESNVHQEIVNSVATEDTEVFRLADGGTPTNVHQS